MKVKPVNPDAVIRDPHTRRPLPATGGDVPDSNFWRRRLRAGEVVPVVLVTRPVTAAPTGNEPLSPLTTRDLKEG